MKTILTVILASCSLCANASSTQFDASVKEIRAILDVPVLSDLINNSSIKSIKKIEGSSDVFEVDGGFCKAQIRVVKNKSVISNPTAESLGAECGP